MIEEKNQTQWTRHLPAWWQVLLVLGCLGIAVYKQKPYWGYIETDAVVMDVKATYSTKNATQDGCIAVYEYAVKYADKTGKSYWAQHRQTFRTCNLEEIKTGNKTRVYYNPDAPAESLQYINDEMGAGLYLFGIGGMLILFVQFLWNWWKNRK